MYTYHTLILTEFQGRILQGCCQKDRIQAGGSKIHCEATEWGRSSTINRPLLRGFLCAEEKGSVCQHQLLPPFGITCQANSMESFYGNSGKDFTADFTKDLPISRTV